MTTSRIAVLRAVRGALALAVTVLLFGGSCRSLGERDEGPRERAFKKVRPPVAFEMLRDNPGLPLLDLRTRFEFTGPVGHVKGAYNVPLEELPQRLLELVVLKDRTFLVYCGHDECGAQGLTILLEAGFRQAVLMDGGIDAWVMGGFGTVTGPPPVDFPERGSEVIRVD